MRAADAQFAVVPVPVNPTPIGVLVAPVAMLTDAHPPPLASGLNVTRIVQEAQAFKVAPQLFVCANQEA